MVDGFWSSKGLLSKAGTDYECIVPNLVLLAKQRFSIYIGTFTSPWERLLVEDPDGRRVSRDDC